ncbi:UDP-N-acetylglucosamine 2-epimerase (non-hydrolyzing) [Balneolales bacterium ANBcel1]|nr:UDP-N-acetylglucosamine 2-epimerase (non-hydrolyzing) [Balneolales bacterium ANBcel1]
MLIDLIAGARPNFMKIAPVTHAIQKVQQRRDEEGREPVRFRLIHTGQHYDKNMSDDFFRQLDIPDPDANLGAGGGSQAEQTAAIMTGYEKLLTEKGTPDICIVVGDVTSTMACSITAKKLGVRVAHIEGGIRSRDWTMPEEINRIVTDSITDFFFTTSEAANRNLRAEGVADDAIFFVGNTMIDTLYAQLDRLQKPAVWEEKRLQEGGYFVMTLHRPANVDQEEKLRELIASIVDGAAGEPVIFPTHPRTRNILNRLGLSWPNLHYVDPLGYLEFIYLVKRARAVITDSGGITEEATVLGIPCLTLRDNTERPETVIQGTNELVGTDPGAVTPVLERLMSGNWKQGSIPEKWDGRTAERIVDILLELKSSGRLDPPVPYKDETLLTRIG